jgi:hypothetical protein
MRRSARLLERRIYAAAKNSVVRLLMEALTCHLSRSNISGHPYPGFSLSPDGPGDELSIYCQVCGIDYNGVRPSSGAASQDCPSGVAFFKGRGHSNVAAPEDGRTPPL